MRRLVSLNSQVFSEPEMERVLQFEKYINEFFLSVADLLRREDSQEAFFKVRGPRFHACPPRLLHCPR